MKYYTKDGNLHRRLIMNKLHYVFTILSIQQ